MPRNETVVSCLNEQQCHDFLSGKLDDDTSAAIVKHVECCDRCQKSLESLTLPDLELSLTNAQCSAMSQAIQRSSLDDSRPECGEATTESFAGLATGVFRTPLGLPRKLPEIPGYEALEEVATGGMGTVYRARQKHLGRDVAIKVMRGLVNANGAQRFSMEMLAIGKLEHDHIVRAYDAGEADGIPYLVMEFLQGTDLRVFVQPDGMAISINEACKYIRQAGLGLQAAHEAGFVHRDVKPSNLMLTADGTVKLLDLGLAHADDTKATDGENTDEVSIIGSLDYIAPEQGRNTNAADARSDVYSLGCTLFALLTGRAPFSGPEYRTVQQKLLAHACEQRPNASGFNSNVPQGLSDVVIRMMSIDPAERPQTAADVAELLLPFCGEGNGSRRTRLIAAGMAGFFAMLLLFAVIVIKFKDGTTMTINTDKPVASVEVKPDAGFENVSSSAPGTDPNASAASPRLIRKLQPSAQPISAFCFGPASDKAYAVDITTSVLRWDFETAACETVLEGSSPRSSPAIAVTPDGASLFCGGTFGFTRLDLKTGKPRWTIPGSNHRWAALVPGTEFIAHGQRGGATIRRISDGKAVIESPLKSDRSGRFNSSGKRMPVRLREDGTAAIAEILADRIEIKEFNADGFVATDVAMTSDGKHLVAVGERSTAVWETESGKLLHVRKTPLEVPQHFIQPVGDTGLFLTLRGVLRNQLVLWDPVSNLEHLSFAVPSTFSFSVSPSGKQVLTSDFISDRMIYGGTLRLWSLEPYGKRSHKSSGERNNKNPVTNTIEPGDASIDWPADAPEFAKLPFDAANALQYQKQWAAYLGVPVRMEAAAGIKMAMIPPGEFAMGGTNEQVEQTIQHARHTLQSNFNETRLKTCLSAQPKHQVRLSHPLMMSVYEVSVGEYCAAAGRSPSEAAIWYGRTDEQRLKELDIPNCPAHMTWFAAVQFCNRLSEQEDLPPYYQIEAGAKNGVVALHNSGYRLPTEAEWEFACRSGSDDRIWTDGVHSGIKDYAWFRSPQDRVIRDTESVGQKLPNAFGLFDMHGNVAEWCFDFFDLDWYMNSPVNDPMGPSSGRLHCRRGSDRSSYSHNIGNWVRGAPNTVRSAGAIRLVRSILPDAVKDAEAPSH